MKPYKVWRDRGESWVSTHLPTPDAEVNANGPAGAARQAYDLLNQGKYLLDDADLKFIVEDVERTSSSPYWLVEIECRPVVRDIEATTLHDLCEDEDPAKNPRGIHVPAHRDR